MKKPAQEVALADLRRIPGVGPSIARNLYALGIRSVRGLRTQDPQRLFDRLCAHHGHRIDRCVLYVFRCAVYFSRTARPKRDLTLWWNWKDKDLPVRRAGSRGRTIG